MKVQPTDIPEGKYVVFIHRVENIINFERMSHCIRWTLIVLEPDMHLGEVIYKYSFLHKELPLSFFKGELVNLKIRVPRKIAKLDRTLKKCEGLKAILEVRIIDKFYNLNILGRAK
jgi:hypothetical protein